MLTLGDERSKHLGASDFREATILNFGFSTESVHYFVLPNDVRFVCFERTFSTPVLLD